MIHHLLKLLWKQRRQNAWIVAELFLVFILLWYIMDYFTTIGYANSVDSAYDIKDTYHGSRLCRKVVPTIFTMKTRKRQLPYTYLL